MKYRGNIVNLKQKKFELQNKKNISRKDEHGLSDLNKNNNPVKILKLQPVKSEQDLLDERARNYHSTR